MERSSWSIKIVSWKCVFWQTPWSMVIFPSQTIYRNKSQRNRNNKKKINVSLACCWVSSRSLQHVEEDCGRTLTGRFMDLTPVKGILWLINLFDISVFYKRYKKKTTTTGQQLKSRSRWGRSDCIIAAFWNFNPKFKHPQCSCLSGH